MASNSFGEIFTITSYGESHGEALGGIIDGIPAGIKIDHDFIQNELDRRRPGQSKIVTQRKEGDKVNFLSGIFEGETTGTSIGFVIYNENQKSKDYAHIKDVFRPSHADLTYDKKYGNRDYRGGGRSSARETVARVVAGAIAKIALKQLGIEVNAFVDQVGNLKLEKSYKELSILNAENNIVRCPDDEMAQQMEELIVATRKAGDTIGGCVQCVATGVPIGWGEPVFDKLHADLGKAMLSINACKGFEYGSGFQGVEMNGSEHNDSINADFSTKTNYSGGIQGGISNGEDIYMRIAFKPVATIMQKQLSVDKTGKAVEMEGKGRHDPCVVPRAVVIVEAMAAITLFDAYLRNKLSRL